MVEPFKLTDGLLMGFRHLNNTRALDDASYAYGLSASLRKAFSATLAPGLSATERDVLTRFRDRWHNMLTTRWSKTLLYGDTVKYLSVPERVAVIKLVRRGLINLYHVSTANGQFDLWEVVSA